MLDRPPPSRLRVLEKGGRLIVIDTQTGEPPLTAAQTQGGRTAFVAAAPEPEPEPAAVPDPEARAVFTTAMRSALDRKTASPPLSPLKPTRPASETDRQGRIVMLIVLGLISLVFLIWTGAWMIVLVALLIAPIRTIILTAAKSSVTRFLDGAN
jgi:hypothetical protein